MFVSSGASLSQVQHKVRDQVVSIDANWIGCVVPVMGYPVTGTISFSTALDWIGWIGGIVPVMGYPVTGTISLITTLDWIGCFFSICR